MLAVQRFTATGAMDTAFRLYRAYFVPLFLLSLVVAIPNTIMGVVQVFLQHALAAEFITPGAGGESAELGYEGAAFILLFVAFFALTMIVAMIGGMFGLAGATRIASQAALGRPTSLGDALRAALQVFWPLLGASLLMTLSMVMGMFLFIVPGMIIYFGLVFIAPVVVIERTGAVDALGRSWQLTRGRKLKVFSVVMLFSVLFAAASGGILLVTAFSGLLGEGIEQEVAQQLMTQAVSVVAMPVWNVAIVLLYYDARVEHDAFDVQTLASMAEPATEGT